MTREVIAMKDLQRRQFAVLCVGNNGFLFGHIPIDPMQARLLQWIANQFLIKANQTVAGGQHFYWSGV